MNKQLIRRGARAFFGNEKRQAITVPVFAIILSLLIGAIIILLLGKSPLDTYKSLLQGSGLLLKNKYGGGKSILTDFTSFVNAWTPMLFAALSVAVALRAGLFNIGVAGQMLAGGMLATALVGYSSLPAYIAMPLVVIVAALGGAVIGGLIGLLKHKFNINEVVSSIMLNYIVMYIVKFIIETNYLDAITRQSRIVSKTARLTIARYPLGNLKIDLPLGIFLALAAVFILKFMIDKTVLGYEIKKVGANPLNARYSGIFVGKTLLVTMLISGALSGLAGATYYLGYQNSIQPGVLPGMAFDTIAIALLAGGNPVGVIFASFVVNILSKGSIYMQSSTGLVNEMSAVITAIVLLFSACGVYIQFKVKQSNDKIIDKEAK